MTPTRDPGEPAADAAAVRLQAAGADLPALAGRIERCRACPRLVEWREEVAATRRRAFADQRYWGRPVAGFGDPRARLLVVGLAPAAHGANRTGRVFTGDRSGDWLFAALHDVGLADRPTSTAADDGLTLTGARVTAAVRCAPPGNRPTPVERDTCAPWLHAEVRCCAPSLRGVVALGGFAWASTLTALGATGWQPPRPRPRFGHGVRVDLPAGPDAPAGAHDLVLWGCYHPSQQNTFTGRLTAPMLRDLFRDAAATTAASHRRPGRRTTPQG
jgi:uracil-DNA glycosylase